MMRLNWERKYTNSELLARGMDSRGLSDRWSIPEVARFNTTEGSYYFRKEEDLFVFLSYDGIDGSKLVLADRIKSTEQQRSLAQ